MKIGIQLYTIRDVIGGDPQAALDKIARAGYDGVEFAGYFDWKADRLKAALDAAGLVACGSHVPYELLAEHTDEQIEYAKTLGLGNFTIPYLDVKSLLDPEILKTIPRIAEKAEKAGIKLCYHNHYHEFKNKTDGRFVMDAFYDALPGLYAELDTYWATDGGADPIAYMEKLGKRLANIHIKDMKKDPAERKVNANIGEGILPVAEIVRKAQAMGLGWAIVEMDACDGDPIECVTASRANLRKMGF
jgi:sugar phosphate isomerase/epimerase